MGFGKIIAGTSFHRAKAPVNAIVSDGNLSYPQGHPLFVSENQPEGMLLLDLRFDEYSEFKCDVNSDITVHLFQQSAGARYKLFLYPKTQDTFAVSFDGSEQSYSCSGNEPVHVLNVEVYELDGKLYQKLVSSDIAISETFTVNGVSQGAYNSGDVVEQGTSISEVIRKMLQKELPVTYSTPTLSIAADGKSGTIPLEIGTMLTPVIAATFRQNDAGEVTRYSVKRNGQELYNVASVSNFQESGIQLTQDITYQSTVGYSEGAIKNNNFGQPVPDGHILAGEVNASVTFKPTRMFFYQVDTTATQPTAEEIRAFSSDLPKASLTINVPAGAKRIVIAIPNTKQIQTIKYEELGNAEVLDTFTQQELEVTGANGYEAIPYRVYTYIPAIPFPSSATYKISI